MQGGGVKSLLGALRSHMPQDMAKKLKNKNKKYPQMYFEIIKIEATFVLVQLLVVSIVLCLWASYSVFLRLVLSVKQVIPFSWGGSGNQMRLWPRN